MPFATAVSRPQRPKEGVEDEDAVDEAVSSTSLYVANLPYQRSEDDIRAWFQNQVGSAGQVEEVRLILNHEGNPKGAAVISFDTIEATGKALQLDGKPGIEFRKLIVKPDGLKGKKGEGKSEGKGRLKRGAKGEGKTAKGDAGERGAKGRKGEGRSADEGVARGTGDGKSVVVKNLAVAATEANLGELFAGCGEVVAVRIAKDGRNGRPRGFAVVEFGSESAATKALQRSGQTVRGREVRVEIVGGGVQLAPDESVLEEKEVIEADVHTDDAAPVIKDPAESASDISGRTSAAAPLSEKKDSGGGMSIQEHAQMLVAQARDEQEPPAKRKR